MLSTPLAPGSAAEASSDTVLVRTLMEAGYVAAGTFSAARAEAIFAAVKILRPKSEVPVIGQAVAQLNAGDYLAAIRLLRDEALSMNPDNHVARALLGVALQLHGDRSEAETELRKVSEANTDPVATALARSALGQTP
jgi:Flp pilus assembly protein TadD